MKQHIRMLLAVLFAVWTVVSTSSLANGIEKATQLWQRTRNVLMSFPEAEIWWTLNCTIYGNPVAFESNVDIAIQDHMRSLDKPLTDAERLALREDLLDKMKNSPPSRYPPRFGHATIRGNSYLETIRYPDGEEDALPRFTVCWHQGNGTLLDHEVTGSGTTINRGEITSMPSALSTTRHPYRVLSENIAGLIRADTIDLSVDSNGMDVLTFCSENRERLHGKMIMDKESSLPTRIEVYQSAGELRTISEVEWRTISGVWVPGKIKDTVYTTEGVVFSDNWYAIDKFELRNVPDSTFKVAFPVGTDVVDYRVSPPFTYQVEPPGRVEDLIAAAQESIADFEKQADAERAGREPAEERTSEPSTAGTEPAPQVGGRQNVSFLCVSLLAVLGSLFLCVVFLRMKIRAKQDSR